MVDPPARSTRRNGKVKATRTQCRFAITGAVAAVFLLACQPYKPGAAKEHEEPINEGFADEHYEKHLEALRQKVPEGFTIVLQKPFFVIGNEPAEKVRQRALHTVRWTVDRIKQDYFSKDPEDIIDGVLEYVPETDVLRR